MHPDFAKSLPYWLSQLNWDSQQGRGSLLVCICSKATYRLLKKIHTRWGFVNQLTLVVTMAKKTFFYKILRQRYLLSLDYKYILLSLKITVTYLYITRGYFFKIKLLVPTNFEIAPLGLTAILIYHFQINCNVIKIVLALSS